MGLRLAAVMVAASMAWTGSTSGQDSVTQATRAGATSIAGQSFESAKTYFDRGRTLGFPAAGQSTPYVLRAEFTTRGSSGVVETGTYTDTWVSDSKWRREAVFGTSQFVRSRNGKKYYRLDQGPDAALLQFVLTAMEPIPATDGLREEDWRIRRDNLDGTETIEVARGYEFGIAANDPRPFSGYWFDGTGQLARTYGNALETRRSAFGDFNGMQVARRVDVLLGSKVGMQIDVKELRQAGTVDGRMFAIKGHNWVRQFTSEVR